MSKPSFINRLQEIFSTTKHEAVSVMLIVSGLMIGVWVRYNPLADTHSHQYDPVFSQKVYSILDSIADAEARLYTGVDEQGNAPLKAGDTAKAMERYSSSKKEVPTKKINISTALKAELMRLPGIGEAMAERIVEYRKTTPFTSTQDLMNVKGIGKKKFEKIEPYVVFEMKK